MTVCREASSSANAARSATVAGADFTGDDAEGGFADAPVDPGDGFGVPAVAVQHRRAQVAAERGARESEVGTQLVQAHRVSSTSAAAGAGSAVWCRVRASPETGSAAGAGSDRGVVGRSA